MLTANCSRNSVDELNSSVMLIQTESHNGYATPLYPSLVCGHI